MCAAHFTSMYSLPCLLVFTVSSKFHIITLLHDVTLYEETGRGGAYLTCSTIVTLKPVQSKWTNGSSFQVPLIAIVTWFPSA
ncbi:hypothetical protein F5879DRAFT_943144 [Lentinula edodes]|nr:hypothetical protein F5879DRAFT_943144 [Lentinula edodes]